MLLISACGESSNKQKGDGTLLSCELVWGAAELFDANEAVQMIDFPEGCFETLLLVCHLIIIHSIIHVMNIQRGKEQINTDMHPDTDKY